MKCEFKNQLITGIMSCPILYIPHSHFRFVDEVLEELIESSNGNVCGLTKESILEYEMSRGLISFLTKSEVRELSDFSKIETLLSSIVEFEQFDCERIFLFKNFHEALRDTRIQSLLQTFALKYERGDYEDSVTIIIVSPQPVYELPIELEKYIKVIEILPPSSEEIQEMVSHVEVSKQWHFHEDNLRSEFSRNLLGLELEEIRQIMRSCLMRTGGKLTANTIRLSLEEKKNIVRKSGIIQVVDTNVHFDEIGGLDILKHDLAIKGNIFKHLNLARNKKCNVPLPKGILIIGMPGCGKSLIAKSIANEFGVSLLRLDISRLMGKYVGESEENLRKALTTAEAAHPCVLWIDEIEKAFAGSSGGSGEGDMLVMRMMGYFLTWMQERTTAVYIVATANDVMRPEFMRKGRFDEVYFVDFPNAKEREDIFRKKIQKYASSADYPTIYDFSNITSYENIVNESVGQKASKSGFSGSEIECVINTVIERKFIEYVKAIEEEREIAKVSIHENDILQVIKEMKNSVMCNQLSEINKDGSDEKDRVSPNIKKMQGDKFTAIQRIYGLKKEFKSASGNI